MLKLVFVQKLQILCSSYIPILFNFQQLVVKKYHFRNYKMEFQTSNLSNSNGNVKELEREI